MLLQICSFLTLCICSVSGKQPNILLILVDDYGFHDAGYHGSRISTPNIDKLAYSGIRLEKYYVQPLCTPSRSQLMTGMYQIHTGLQHSVLGFFQPSALPKKFPTLPEELKKLGYATHMIGKWHLGYYKEEYLPSSRGFDSFFGFLTGMENYFSHDICSILNYPNGYKKNVCGLDLSQNDENVWTENGTYSTYLFAEKAKNVIEQHSIYTSDKPLFLYLSFQAVHSPLQVPEEYKTRYSFIQDEGRRTLAGMVSCMDEAVGNVIEAFKRYGLWDNTLVILSTDNGGEVLTSGNNWPLRGWKRSLWEGGLRGIGLVSGPLIQSKGSVRHELIHISDWYPTLIHLAGGNTSAMELDSFDVWNTIADGFPSPRSELLHNIDPLCRLRGEKWTNHTYDIRVRSALRMGDWKLITGDPNNGSWVPPPEDSSQIIPDPDPMSKNLWLFDLNRDPYETNDLSAMYPDIVHTMLDRLSVYNATAVPCIYPPDDPRANPELHGGAYGPWE